MEPPTIGMCIFASYTGRFAGNTRDTFISLCVLTLHFFCGRKRSVEALTEGSYSSVFTANRARSLG